MMTDTINEPVEQAKKTLVYFVQEGRMHSSWVIGYLDICASVEESASNFRSEIEIATNILTSGSRREIESNTNLHMLISRPGRWAYLSGSNVVHAGDLYNTREAAAEAYKQGLLDDL
jgi:hypothetical protein